jgi:hypothetical protein
MNLWTFGRGMKAPKVKAPKAEILVPPMAVLDRAAEGGGLSVRKRLPGLSLQQLYLI